MSVFSQDFEKEKENISLQSLKKITEGVNRIRFIENKILHKGNRFVTLLSNNKQILETKQQNQQSFIYTNLKCVMSRRPINQLRQISDSKYRKFRQEYMENIEQVKQYKRQIKSVLAKRNQDFLVEKISRRKKLMKEKEIERIKMASFIQNRRNSIKQQKYKLELKMKEKTERYFQDYETKLILTEKAKQFILLKYSNNSQQKRNQYQ